MLMPREPIWVKSEKPRWPGSCVWRKITSCSGPCSARQARIRRSRVRRTPGSRSGCRCISASNTPTERMPGLFSRIGTTSVSKISARGSGRRRPRGAAFPERRDGSSASRYPVARLKPAFAAATSIVWVFFRVMKNLLWRSVTWRPGTPALLLRLGKGPSVARPATDARRPGAKSSQGGGLKLRAGYALPPFQATAARLTLIDVRVSS